MFSTPLLPCPWMNMCSWKCVHIMVFCTANSVFPFIPVTYNKLANSLFSLTVCSKKNHMKWTNVFNACSQIQFSVSNYCSANVAACLPYLYHWNPWRLLERHSPSRLPRSGSSWASPELRLWVLTNWGQESSGQGSWSSRDRCQSPQMSFWHLGAVQISVRTWTNVQSHRGHRFQESHIILCHKNTTEIFKNTGRDKIWNKTITNNL